ncbi:MAG: phosphatidylglycerophosphatase A [Candidimonas sp.]|nr:MAG: phosphatidylglycerophosphatase A [Candidimonas sp.]
MSMGNPQHASGSTREPTVGWVFRAPWRILAFGFGSGLPHPASGTWGTLFAWLLWFLLLRHASDALVGGILIVAFAVGCWACHVTGRELGHPDYGGMVWDEIVAFWLVLWLVPASFGAQLLAFVIFRAFDITKPPPIHFFDARIKNGFGVMWDDILAAGYTLLVMAVLIRLRGLL